MRIILVIAIISFLISCSDNSATGKQLAGTDSLVINFNAPGTDSIINTVTTTEINAIKKLKQFVGGKKAAEFKCGYDGNIAFYVDGKLAGDFSFNYSGEGCHHFIQLVDGQLSSTAMSNEAADFLKGLAEGKNWY